MRPTGCSWTLPSFLILSVNSKGVELKIKPFIVERAKKKIKLLEKEKQMNEIKFAIYHKPRSAKRTRYSGRNFRFYVPGAATNKKQIRKIIQKFIPEDFK